jgi:hypothetical protein
MTDAPRQFFFHTHTAGCKRICVLDRIREYGWLTLYPEAEAAALDVERLLEMTGRDHPHDPSGECGTCEAYRYLNAAAEYAYLAATPEQEEKP